MLNVFLVCLTVFVVLFAAEMAWHKGWLKGELGRKFVHIAIGSYVAFWPLFLTWNQIILLSGSFIAVIAVSKYLNIFRAIHTVHRPTWGEAFFAVVVGLLALVTQDGWVYMTALLHMSLADGLAAIIGVHLGKQTQYKVLGHTKSVVGTAAFFMISVGLLLVYTTGAGTNLNLAEVLLIASVATMLENISLRGFDNLTVPLWVAVALMVMG